MKVLISAYACEPNKGSEPGAGWNWSLAAARDHEVWVLTRANNRVTIEAELRRQAQPDLHFVFVDLPRWASWWKRGPRGLRLYYGLWQFAMLREARRLHREECFDVVHHLTFATAWLPALVCLVPAPFVYGPVGGGPAVPLRLYPELGGRGVVSDVALRLFRALNRVNPLVRLAWSRACVIVVQNEETQRLFRGSSAPVRVHPNASVAFDGAPRESHEPQTALFAGRLVPWKGASLAIRAMVFLPDWRLEIVGRGPDKKRLGELAESLGLTDRVSFSDWCSQRALWEKIRRATLLLYPSMKEDAGLVVAEAVALGVPVVAIAIGGPVSIGACAAGAVEIVGPASRRDLPELLAQRCQEIDRSDVVYLPSPAFGPGAIANHICDYYTLATRAWKGSAARTRWGVNS